MNQGSCNATNMFEYKGHCIVFEENNLKLDAGYPGVVASLELVQNHVPLEANIHCITCFFPPTHIVQINFLTLHLFCACLIATFI